METVEKMNIFTILIVVIVSWVYTYFQKRKNETNIQQNIARQNVSKRGTVIEIAQKWKRLIETLVCNVGEKSEAGERLPQLVKL